MAAEILAVLVVVAADIGNLEHDTLLHFLVLRMQRWAAGLVLD